MDEWIRYVSVPYRGATFLNAMDSVVKELGIKVSVPYRGATFLNFYGVNVKKSDIVSVPYRGATFLNRTQLTYR